MISEQSNESKREQNYTDREISTFRFQYKVKVNNKYKSKILKEFRICALNRAVRWKKRNKNWSCIIVYCGEECVDCCSNVCFGCTRIARQLFGPSSPRKLSRVSFSGSCLGIFREPICRSNSLQRNNCILHNSIVCCVLNALPIWSSCSALFVVLPYRSHSHSHYIVPNGGHHISKLKHITHIV